MCALIIPADSTADRQPEATAVDSIALDAAVFDPVASPMFDDCSDIGSTSYQTANSPLDQKHPKLFTLKQTSER